MSHDDHAPSGPGPRWAPRWAPLAVGAALLVVLGLGVGIIGLNQDGPTTVPDCGAEGPTGPTPCRFLCVPLGGALRADHSKANDVCVYDPAATPTTATFGPPPTTAPSNGLQPMTPAPAAGGRPAGPG